MRYRRGMRAAILKTSCLLVSASSIFLGCGDGEKPATTGEPPVPDYCTSETAISKGPWVVRVDGSSAVVRWEACRKGTKPDLMFEIESGSDKRTVISTEMPFEVTATNIAPLDPTAPKDEAGMYY